MVFYIICHCTLDRRFIREEYNQVINDLWKHRQGKRGLEIYGWCIMASHVHMIIGSRKDKLEDIVRDTKKHKSSELKTAIKNNSQESRKEWMLWMMERAGTKNINNKDWQFGNSINKPLEIKSQQMFDEKINYIHQNPVQAGFLTREEDWKYSSARDFAR
ncbi:MAG: transposase [Ferruginibacter sp.]